MRDSTPFSKICAKGKVYPYLFKWTGIAILLLF